MNTKPGALTQLTTSLLVLWVIATVGLLALLDLSDTALVGWALTGLVVVTAMARPFWGSTMALVVLSIVTYFAVQFHRAATITGVWLEVRLIIQLLPGALAIAVAGLLARAAALRMADAEGRLDRSLTAVEELTIYDEATGTLKRVYAEKELAGEVDRARRYKRPISVVMVGVDDWRSVVKERGDARAAEALIIAAAAMKESLRNMDRIARYDESVFLVLLPETPGEGAQVVARRLREVILQKAKLEIRCGVAEFPSDALGRDELISEAEAALRFAGTAGMDVAGHGLMV